jgi:glycosyltransferase involved in cell wall biosynthesis
MTEEEIIHTIAVCNYNMGETLEESLISIIEQVNHRDDFEVLVIDDGSSDESPKILSRLQKEYDILRVQYLEYDPERNLGKTRNISFQESKGEYILESLDTDDEFHQGILDFVDIYHQIENQVDQKFYLQFKGFAMSKRDLLLEIPYRNLPRGQDKDLRRRMLANDSLFWIVHNPIRESLGYDPGFVKARQIWFEEAVTEFRTGITLTSYLTWAIGLKSLRGLFLCIISPFAYLLSLSKEQYDTESEYKNRIKWKQDQNKIKSRLSELEPKYGITIDFDRLSDQAEEIFNTGVKNEK